MAVKINDQRRPIDCCIAQIAIENKVLLLHDDRDFLAIAKHFPLQQMRWVREEGRSVHESGADYSG